jgi:hypothetical protein
LIVFVAMIAANADENIHIQILVAVSTQLGTVTLSLVIAFNAYLKRNWIFLVRQKRSFWRTQFKMLVTFEVTTNDDVSKVYRLMMCSLPVAKEGE